jgi:hypothetical protein
MGNGKQLNTNSNLFSCFALTLFIYLSGALFVCC